MIAKHGGAMDGDRLKVDRDAALEMIGTLQDAESYHRSIKKPGAAKAARGVIDALKLAHDIRPQLGSGEGGEPTRGTTRFDIKPKPIHPESLTEARHALASGTLAAKGNADSPVITSDLTGLPIRRYIELPDGSRVHPDELARARTDDDGETTLGPENLTVKDPLNHGDDTQPSFERAVTSIASYGGHDDDRVTLQSPHGYAVTKTRNEWRDVAASIKDKPEAMAQWYDRENPEGVSAAAEASEVPSASAMGEREQDDFFRPRGEQGRLFMRPDLPGRDGPLSLSAGVEYVRAPVGGASSPVNGNWYEGGWFMPVHGKSEAKKKEKSKKQQRPTMTRNRFGELVEVPEHHRAIEGIVAGSPEKSHRVLSDHALNNTLGLTREQAKDLAEIWEMDGGAPYVAWNVLPESTRTIGVSVDPDWDIMAKWKEDQEQAGEARRQADKDRLKAILEEEARLHPKPEPRKEDEPPAGMLFSSALALAQSPLSVSLNVRAQALRDLRIEMDRLYPLSLSQSHDVSQEKRDETGKWTASPEERVSIKLLGGAKARWADMTESDRSSAVSQIAKLPVKVLLKQFNSNDDTRELTVGEPAERREAKSRMAAIKEAMLAGHGLHFHEDETGEAHFLPKADLPRAENRKAKAIAADRDSYEKHIKWLYSDDPEELAQRVT